MKKARIALMGGMGYPLTETAAGMPRLKSRFAVLGVETILVNWSHRQEVYNFLNGFKGFRGLMGDSLGAGSAAQYAGDLDGDNVAGHLVDFVGGFQPSQHDTRAHNSFITVAGNVVVAHAIFDPVWIDTAGLGYARYVKTENSATRVLNTEHRGMHPDDWSWSQDILLKHCLSLMEDKDGH